MHNNAPSKNYQITVYLLVMLGLLPLGVSTTYIYICVPWNAWVKLTEDREAVGMFYLAKLLTCILHTGKVW